MTRFRCDTGSVSVLALGLALVTFAISGLAVDGTRVLLFRRSLQNASDSIALAAASELDESRYYRSGGDAIRVDSGAARSVAESSAAARGLDARLSVRSTAGRIEVVLRGEVATTFLSVVGIDSIPVAASATASPIPGPPDG